MNKLGTLYIVATPIGNLEDITFRAIRVLKEVDLIACEDTRVTKKLLDHFEIKTPTVSYFQHSNITKIDYLIDQLLFGKDIALVSDAGTPGISDPGEYLVSVVREKAPEIKILPIPGATAIAAMASVSGMIEKEFYFAGFLPKKKGRQTELGKLSALDCPIIIYESPNRLEGLLEEIRTYLGKDTQVFIARESTKLFEEYWHGECGEILNDLSSHTLKGEVAILVQKSKKRSKTNEVYPEH